MSALINSLALFSVLERADPALVDPGVTAQLECLLDEVLLGRQEMMGAIDAVCAQAQRIIGRLTAGAEAGNGTGPGQLPGALAGMAGQDRPPTPAMRRYVDSLARQKGVKPPSGYTRSAAVCRAFLDRHAPKTGRTGADAADDHPRPAAMAHGAAGEDLAPDQGGPAPGLPAPVPVTASRGANGRKSKPQRQVPRKATSRTPELGTKRRAGGKRAGTTAASPVQQRAREPVSPGETPLRIPFGNKDAALRLGARYRAGGWYAPPETDLRPFQEHGWL